MVAVIKTGSSLRRIFNYNELKVKEGIASCLLAENYPMDAGQMSVSQKLNRLLNQAKLNENVKRNSVHISLNFAPSEVLSENRLQAIAKEYMEQIGFGEQPYLVYQHRDAGHPHVHLVTTKIRSDGSRIDTQNIGKNQSEKARKAIELKYGLVKAEDHKRQAYQLQPVNVQKVHYGKTPTKRAITNVLDAVLKQYKYTSLPELNAVLNRYNIMADRGNEGSRVFENRGLYYRIVDETGNKTGVPVKASDIYNNPGLKFLEEWFKLNDAARIPYKSQVKNMIDLALHRSALNLEQLALLLQKDGISMVIRQNKEGLIYGITYVDHRSKCVFNGSALGKNYSAKAIQDRCSQTVSGYENKKQAQDLMANTVEKGSRMPGDNTMQSAHVNENLSSQPAETFLLDTLMKAENTYEPLPIALKRTRKKKKRKQRFTSQ